MQSDSQLIQVAADVIAGIFLWSGTTKVRRPLPAAMAIVDFGLTSRVIPGLAIALGAGEIALGLWILSELAIGIALVGASLLLMLFGALIVVAVVRGRNFPCACFGDSDDTISWGTALRSVVLLTVATYAAIAVRGRPGMGTISVADLRVWTMSGSLLGSFMLLSLVPRLVSWNRGDPNSIGSVRW